MGQITRFAPGGNCCGPPDTLCVAVNLQCANSDDETSTEGKSYTVRYQGPNGEDLTRTVTTLGQDCYGRTFDTETSAWVDEAPPDAGEWTVTVTPPAPWGPAQTKTVDVSGPTTVPFSFTLPPKVGLVVLLPCLVNAPAVGATVTVSDPAGGGTVSGETDGSGLFLGRLSGAGFELGENESRPLDVTVSPPPGYVCLLPLSASYVLSSYFYCNPQRLPGTPYAYYPPYTLPLSDDCECCSSGSDTVMTYPPKHYSDDFGSCELDGDGVGYYDYTETCTPVIGPCGSGAMSMVDLGPQTVRVRVQVTCNGGVLRQFGVVNILGCDASRVYDCSGSETFPAVPNYPVVSWDAGAAALTGVDGHSPANQAGPFAPQPAPDGAYSYSGTFGSEWFLTGTGNVRTNPQAGLATSYTITS